MKTKDYVFGKAIGVIKALIGAKEVPLSMFVSEGETGHTLNSVVDGLEKEWEKAQ